MSYMKEYMIDIQDKMISKAAAESGIEKDVLWLALDVIANSPTSEGPLEDIEDVCEIVRHGEKSIITEFEERTGCIVKRNKILDLYEDVKYDSRSELLCDIIYTLRELRREQCS